MGHKKVTMYLIVLLVVITGLGILPVNAALTEQAKLLDSIETQDRLKKWNSSGTITLSGKHVTEGEHSLRIAYDQVNPAFGVAGFDVDISGYGKIKFDAYLEGAPMTVNARFRDTSGNVYTSWYYLINNGYNVIEYSIAGLATEIDTKHFAGFEAKSDSAYSGSYVADISEMDGKEGPQRAAIVYIDNLRLTKGPDDDSWLLKQKPSKLIIKVPGNIVQNNDFELGMQNWGSWGKWDGGTYTFGSGEAENVKSGQASLAIICETPGRGGVWTSLQLKPGEYTLAYWVKGSAPGCKMFHNLGNAKTIEGADSSYFDVPTDWTKRASTLKVERQTQSGLYLYSVGPGTVYIDAVSLARKAEDTDDLGAEQQSLKQSKPRKVTLDKNRTLIDGKPFFPVGIYNGKPSELTGTGFNLLSSVSGVSDTVAALDECEKYGMMMWVSLSGLARSHLPAKADEIARRYRNHPALLTWYTCDEPDHSFWNVPPPEIRAMSKTLAKEDCDHPSSVLFMAWAPSNSYQYADTADILMIDPYSWKIPTLLGQVDTLRDAAGPDKPVWIVLRLGWDNEKEPSSQYLYATTYGSITHTADGVLWFSYHPDKYPTAWSALTKITLELKELSPILLADTSSRKVSVSNPVIHTIIKKHKGKMYLITINISTEAVENVKMTIAGAGSSQAKVKFENRSTPVVNSIITDSFKPNERHVYVLSK
ncbi:MAG: hypothetical protein ACYS1A_12485 [Planctomycetota bacterium]|jgi:hypothetical protein